MNLVIITDAFPPLRSSAAVQLRDLALEFVRQGHKPVVLVASPGLEQAWAIEDWRGVRVVRLRSPQTKDVGYLRRVVAEFLMPFAMLRHFRLSPLGAQRWDGVIWYSPTIFLGVLANAIKKSSKCSAYLILRDIFPRWAVDMGLMGRGLPYWMLRAVEIFQYSVADVIGVQSPGNLAYFERWAKRSGRQLEVLHNWLAEAPAATCGINVANGRLAGRTIFVYAGNMGVAQGLGRLLELADRLSHRSDIGFLFVGRGSDAHALRERSRLLGLENVEFHDEIEPSEIAGLYAQCHIGMIALDPRHTTHNIPGKFLSYMHAGLPVLAAVNPGNDLVALIDREAVGRTHTGIDIDAFASLAEEFVDSAAMDLAMKARCRKLAQKMFSPQKAVAQVVNAIAGETDLTSLLVSELRDPLGQPNSRVNENAV